MRVAELWCYPIKSLAGEPLRGTVLYEWDFGRSPRAPAGPTRRNRDFADQAQVGGVAEEEKDRLLFLRDARAGCGVGKEVRERPNR